MSPKGTVITHRLWKRFRADRRRMLLRDELQRVAARLRGTAEGGWRWALRDVDLRAEPGEAIGLVGANGSGKTTMLKILAGVMYPYAGSVAVTGRVGALLEVRTGIHPDLTGRENVYLTGSLLGLRRREVARRFDEIVAFAELEDAVDRQVKFYSSGMQMRLGFAVAAFLEPDVLLVDEALAVGDASFQQKCLDRMREVLAQGTTLIFVSHDLAAVEATCPRGVWLKDGEVVNDGPVADVMRAYRGFIEEAAEIAPRKAGLVQLLKAEVGGDEDAVRTDEPLDVRLMVESMDARSGGVYLGVSEGPATPIFVVKRDIQLKAGQTDVRCRLTRLPLPRGRYYLWVGMVDAAWHDLLSWHPAVSFDVTGPSLDAAPPGIARSAPVHVQAVWEVASP